MEVQETKQQPDTSSEVIHIDPKKTKKIPKEVYEAYQCLWRTDVAGADAVLLKKQQDAKKKGSTVLWVETALAEVYFWKYSLNENSENKKALESQLNKLEKIGDQITESHNPDSLGNKVGSFFSSGTADRDAESKKYILFLDGLMVYAYWHFLSAAWNFRNEERVKGAWHFQRCWARLSEILELITKIDKLSDKHKVDPALLGMIDFGVGIYHFIISLVPPSLQIITTIAGFEADRDKAFEEFGRTISSGCVWSPLATIIRIALKHFFLDEKEVAKKDLEQLQQSFPKSVIICYFSAFMARMNGEPLKSIEYYTEILTLVPENEKLTSGINYNIGNANFLLNDWEKVITHYEKFLQRPVKENYDKALRPYVCYILSFAHYVQAGKQMNDQLLKKINELHANAKTWMRPDESYDLYAKRKIKEFAQKKTFDKFDELTIICEGLREGQQWDRCLDILESEFTDLLAIPDNQSKRDYFALYFYIKGACQKGKKLYEEAELTLRKALKEEGKLSKEQWIIPFSWLVLGEMYLEMKKWDEASDCFDKATKKL